MADNTEDSHNDEEPKAPRRRSGRGSSGALPEGVASGEAAAAPAEAGSWMDSLKEVQKSIDGATGAVNQLRAALQEMAPMWRTMVQLEEALRTTGLSETAARPTSEGSAADTSAAGVLAAEGPQVETTAREAVQTPEAAVGAPGALRPLVAARATRPARPSEAQAVAFAYTLTVEDTKRRVELAPLHRALRSVPGVRDMSLLAYTNGIATIALDSRAGLEAPALEAAIAGTTNRECKIWARSPDSFLVRVGK